MLDATSDMIAAAPQNSWGVVALPGFGTFDTKPT